MLRALCAAGLQLAIVSQKLRPTLLACLEREGLAQCFQLVRGCEDVPAPKPDPGGLLLAADRLNLPPARCLFTGDSLVDQEAARAAGMPFAAMLRGATAREQFDARFVRWYFDSAEQMARTLLQELPVAQTPGK